MLHLLLIIAICGVSVAGYISIIWAGDLRGYEASKLIALRNLGFLTLVLPIFFWLTRKHRFRGEMLILTAAVFLFAVGMLMQFRLFADPEYGARGQEKGEERRSKAQAVRLLNIKTAYDDEKKTFMFGSPQAVPKEPVEQNGADSAITIGGILTSPNTYIPITALLALVVGFLFFKNDKNLLWLQEHSLLVGIGTLIPTLLLVILYFLFGDNGKLFGQTPWEGVKVLFLVSFSAILADTYRHLRRTRWGLPPAQYLIPFLLIAVMSILPFFLLKDFGQLLVFFGVYLVLYLIAVRNQAKLFYALILLAVVFGTFLLGSKLFTGSVVPGYVQFRFYVWTDMWTPPSPDTPWWKNDAVFRKHIRDNKSLDMNDPDDRAQISREAWRDKTAQLSQGLFGLNEGGVIGTGLGLGYPETIHVSDSDFIYTAIAEEMGLIGGLSVLLALMVIVIAGTAVSLGAPDMFSKLLAAGFTTFVGFQAIVNIGGVLRLMPMTGITLPFVSHGGWSLITSFAMLGILLALSHRNARIYQDAKVEEAHDQPQFLPVR